MAERKKPLINLPVNPRTKEYIAKKKKLFHRKQLNKTKTTQHFPNIRSNQPTLRNNEKFSLFLLKKKKKKKEEKKRGLKHRGRT